METVWLHRSGQERLIVFCAGWGMDERPFLHLSSKQFDVLFLYDFRGMLLETSLLEDITAYGEIILIGWSMGVWCGRKIFENVAFSQTIAINGTLCPIHDCYGIPRELFVETMRNWSDEAKMKFYRRMCREKKVLESFVKVMPARGIKEQQQELAYYLDNAKCMDNTDDFYTDILVSDRDFVVPTKHQQLFWENQQVKMLSGSHFPFFKWQSWDEMMMVISAAPGVNY